MYFPLDEADNSADNVEINNSSLCSILQLINYGLYHKIIRWVHN